jgi:hypothetical protein
MEKSYGEWVLMSLKVLLRDQDTFAENSSERRVLKEGEERKKDNTVERMVENHWYMWVA